MVDILLRLAARQVAEHVVGQADQAEGEGTGRGDQQHGQEVAPVNCSITAPALLWSTGDARGLDRLCSCDLTEQEKLEDGHLEMALAFKLNPIFYCPQVLFFFFVFF